MEDVFDVTMMEYAQTIFFQKPFYLVLFVCSLISLFVFRKEMERGRRFFLLYSLICLVLFIYNPVFFNLCGKYLLGGVRVRVRLFLLLPVLYTEAYVLACIVISLYQKKRALSCVSTMVIVSLLFIFGNMPYQGAKEGDYSYETPMIIMGENLYKIPQEHINITESILNDMDGERTTLSIYEMKGKNDEIGGTLNFSIRMYTSRIQLREVISSELYTSMGDEERSEYWAEYISSLDDGSTDSTSFYFLFPIDDERVADLIAYGCVELSVDSSNYCLLEYDV